MIAILDYGSGNLRSAARAFATSGLEVVITDDSKVALDAKGLVVPGVGAFQSCMSGIKNIGGDEIVRIRIAKERAVFGICIGMQILFSAGEEHMQDQPHEGIGVWQGAISKLQAPVLPHIGWNTVEATKASQLFQGVENESFYFVHSYAAKKSIGKRESWTTHGEKFISAIEDGYVSATQFHPEKSGKAGLQLIKNWSKSL